MIFGHEGCAEVVEVGELVKDFKLGDRVLVPAITPDWNPLEAQAGYSMHSGGMLAGWKFLNFQDGVFSEFFYVNDADGNLALLPDNISTADACTLSNMVPTGFHGVELAAVQFGDSVLVIGIGPAGLMSVAGANLRGASRIIAAGMRPVCVEAAKGCGAVETPRQERSGFCPGGKGKRKKRPPQKRLWGTKHTEHKKRIPLSGLFECLGERYLCCPVFAVPTVQAGRRKVFVLLWAAAHPFMAPDAWPGFWYRGSL